MMNTVESHKDFATFAADFRHENKEILVVWGKSSDPLRRAVARIIADSNEAV